MKPILLFLTSLALLPAFAASPKSDPGDLSAGTAAFGSISNPTAVAAGEAAKRHPLRGVITAVHADRSSIMVKHEEIPGVMRAMTMLFHVDEATLKTVQKGQTITAMLSREADEWWLHDVKVVAPPPTK